MYANKLFTVRLCHLKKSSKTSLAKNDEYGFNLKAKTSGLCHYIGRVDLNTPADLGGLKSGDKIIEINNMNVHNFNFEQIMQHIKMGLNRNGKCYKDEVLLMVIDQKIDEYYNNINAPIEGYNPNFSIMYKSSNFTYINVDSSQNGSNRIAESSDSDSGESNNVNIVKSSTFKTAKHNKYKNAETTSYLKCDDNDDYQITFI